MSLLAAFDDHVATLRTARDERRAMTALRSLHNDDNVHTGDDEALGIQLPSERFRGDTNMRTLQCLLRKIDELGFERSDQQLSFHDAFLKATARVLYRDDWATSKPAILAKNGWQKVCSEVCISTPRRFGKTFS